MHRLAIKRTTKNETHQSPNTHVTASAANRHSAIRCDRRLRVRGVLRVPRLPSADWSVRAEVCGLRICTRYDRLSQQQLSFLLNFNLDVSHLCLSLLLHNQSSSMALNAHFSCERSADELLRLYSVNPSYQYCCD